MNRQTVAPITLKSLPEATAQQVFDQVAVHLLTQGRKSTWMDGHACCYHGGDGLKCAAGNLIGDDEYNLDLMEEERWPDLVRDGVVPKAHAVLIAQLQDLHDECDVTAWKHSLLKIAGMFNLSAAAIDAL